MIAKGVGKLADLRQIPKNKTAQLARNALGADLDQAVNALRNAPPGASVAEVTANIQNPAWQALIRDGLEKTPQGAQYLNKFATMSHDEGVNSLSRLVGGTTAAEVRGTTEAAKEAARTITSPMRESALTRANLGKEVAYLEGLSADLGEQAAAKVQEVGTSECTFSHGAGDGAGGFFCSLRGAPDFGRSGTTDQARQGVDTFVVAHCGKLVQILSTLRGFLKTVPDERLPCRVLNVGRNFGNTGPRRCVSQRIYSLIKIGTKRVAGQLSGFIFGNLAQVCQFSDTLGDHRSDKRYGCSKCCACPYIFRVD
jgi:hypothetical protein